MLCLSLISVKLLLELNLLLTFGFGLFSTIFSCKSLFSPETFIIFICNKALTLSPAKIYSLNNKLFLLK